MHVAVCQGLSVVIRAQRLKQGLSVVVLQIGCRWGVQIGFREGSVNLNQICIGFLLRSVRNSLAVI